MYQARSLYQLLSGLSPDYDDADCAGGNGGNQRLTQNGQLDGGQAYSLYPNPNEGNFVIARNTPTVIQSAAQRNEGSVHATVYDILGRHVLHTKLNFVNGKANIQLSHAFPGQYMMYINDESAGNTRIKFTVK